MKERISILLLACCLAGLKSSGQNTTFMRLAQVPGLNFGLSFTETADGGMVGTGQDDGGGGHGVCDLYIYKVDECGVTEWYKRYGGPNEDGGKYVTQLANGGYAVAGLTTSSGGGGYDNWLIKFDALGNMLWSKTFGTANSEHGRCVAEAPNGDLILTGFVNARDGVIFRVDATGNTIWQKSLSLVNCTANYVEVFPNGDILLLGDFNGPYGLRDAFVARLTSTGNLIWAKQLGTGGEDGIDWDVAGRITTTGFVLSCTMDGFGTGEDMVLSSFDGAGNVLWKKRVYGAGQDKAHFVNQTTDGGYLQSGFTTSWGFGGADVMVNRFDINGVHQWTRIYGSTAIDKGWGIQESADSGYLISALTTSFGALYYDPLFIKTDSLGMMDNCPHIQTPPVTVVDAGYSISNLTFNLNTVDYFTSNYLPTGIDVVPVDQLVCFDCTNVPQFSISDSVLCEGEPLYLINETTVGLICAQEWFIEDTTGGNISTLPGSDTAIYVFDQAGYYNIVLNADCGNQTNSDTLNIIVLPKPEAGFEFQDACINSQPVTIVDTSTFIPTIWNWTVDGNPIGSGQTIQYSFSDTGDFTIGLIVENFFGCLDTMDQSIHIHDKPTAAFSFNDTCFGMPHSFLNSSSTIDGVISGYEWDFGDLSTSAVQNPTHTYAAPGAYMVQLIVTTDLGCSDTLVQEVNAWVNPQAAFNSVSSCLNQPTQMENTTIDGDWPLTSIIWNFGNAQINGPTASFTYPNAGSFPVQLVVTDQVGCMDSITQNVTVHPLPDVDVSVQDECAHITLNITNTSSIATGTIDSTNWLMGDGASYDAVIPLHAYQGPGLYDVTVFLESDEGCSSDTTFEVEAFPIPVAGLTIQNVCDTNAVQFLETSSVAAPGILTLSDWVMGNGLGFPDTSITQYVYSTFGDYPVILAVETQHGCVDTIAGTATVHPNPTANFVFNQICLYDSAQFNDGSSVATGAIVAWNWDFGNNQSFNDQIPSFQHYPAAGFYPIELTVTTDSGCVNQMMDTIEVYPVPIANFQFDSICFPGAIQFTDLSDPNGIYGITQYEWDFSDGQTSDLASPAIAFLAPGGYSASLQVTNSQGCEHDIAIGEALVHPLPDAAFNGNFEHCFTETLHISDTSSVMPISNDVIDSWTFNLGDGSQVLAPTGVHQYSAAGFYDVMLIIETNHGCLDSITHTIEVYPKPEVAFTADPISGCVPLTVQFHDESTIIPPYFINQWSWTLGDSATTVSAPDPIMIYDPPNVSNVDSLSYDVSLRVTSYNGCPDTLTVSDMITVYPLPEAFFRTDPNKIATILEPIFEFTDLSSENVSSWYWEFGDGGTSSIENPTHAYTDTGEYTVDLYVETAVGCLDHITYTIIVEPVFTFYIPDAFTPNSDGVNEQFLGTGTGIREYHMAIYNRWGDLIYETGNPEAGWDGTFLGAPVEQAEYVYRFYLVDWRGHDHTYSGGFTLFR